MCKSRVFDEFALAVRSGVGRGVPRAFRTDSGRAALSCHRAFDQRPPWLVPAPGLVASGARIVAPWENESPMILW